MKAGLSPAATAALTSVASSSNATRTESARPGGLRAAPTRARRAPPRPPARPPVRKNESDRARVEQDRSAAPCAAIDAAGMAGGRIGVARRRLSADVLERVPGAAGARTGQGDAARNGRPRAQGPRACARRDRLRHDGYLGRAHS